MNRRQERRRGKKKEARSGLLMKRQRQRSDATEATTPVTAGWGLFLLGVAFFALQFAFRILGYTIYAFYKPPEPVVHSLNL